MAKKSKKSVAAPQSGKGQQAAKAGLGAAVVAALVWLTGGFTRENGLEWIKSIGIAVGLALLIRWPVGEPFRIPSGSMEPTLLGDPRPFRGDRVWVNKFIYGVRFPLNDCFIPLTGIRIRYANSRIFRYKEPQRWDIVVFKSVEKEPKHNTLIKRVVGLPGEQVHIGVDGKIYINGEPVPLPEGMPPVRYTRVGWYGIETDEAHSLVPEGHYLLLGDNSGSSRDGRFWGWVPNEHILGRAAAIWWPPRRWRDFTGFSDTWWWRTAVGMLGLLIFVRLFLGRSWRTRHPEDETRGRNVHLYINRLAYGLPVPFSRLRFSRGRPPQRGELALYACPENAAGHEGLLLGRIAGLPGEKVRIDDDGRLHIDETAIENPPVLAERRFPFEEGMAAYGKSRNKEYSQVPDDQYFLLSDEALSDDSCDSRTVGWVPRDHLVGPATAVWWPLRLRRKVT